MSRELSEIPLPLFRERLRALVRHDLPDSVCAALHQHYEELRRWNPRLSLVGPGTVDEVLSRHYGESLAALDLLRDDDRTLVDLGSGAGFPGLVLAAARPDLRVTLVEARERKWSFLRRASRRSGLSCRCLNARVESPLPADFPVDVDLVTSRALAIGPDVFEALLESSPRARFLLWQGELSPRLPPDLVVRRERPLEGSDRRRIVEIGRK